MANVKVKQKSIMEFATTRFGPVEVKEENIIRFIDEIPGFPDAERFILIPHAKGSPFSWLQSVEMPEVAFVVTNPWLFFENYEPIISEADLDRIESEGKLDENLVVLSILTIPDDPRRITANLKAPIIINSRNNAAKQVILANDNYFTKHPLIPDSQEQ